MINRGNIIKKIKLNTRFLLVFSYFFSIFIAFLVYFTGGTSRVYANLMYIPIAIVSSSQGKKQGVIHAVISGLLVGPLMPLDVEANIYQQPINWLMRVLIYSIIALVVGFFADYRRRNLKKFLRKIKNYQKPKWLLSIP